MSSNRAGRWLSAHKGLSFALVVVAILLLGIFASVLSNAANNRRADVSTATPRPTRVNRDLPERSSFEMTRGPVRATPATVHSLDEPYGGWETDSGYAFVLDEDGTAIVMNPDGTTGIGEWTIEGSTLCLVGGGEELCETYRQDGDVMTFGGLTFYRR